MTSLVSRLSRPRTGDLVTIDGRGAWTVETVGYVTTSARDADGVLRTVAHDRVQRVRGAA